MKIKTADLTSLPLAYAVAIAKGIPAEEIVLPRYQGDGPWRRTRDEEGNFDGYITGPAMLFDRKWEAAGPIIEKERIDLQAKINAGCDYDEWLATIGLGAAQRRRYGPTPIIAAMRCFVASKLGDEVEIPDILEKFK